MSAKLEDYFDFLSAGDIRIKGHRVGIEHVLFEYVFRAKTPEEIHKRFPTLTLEQIYATILYYLRNRRAADKYLADWIDFGRKARAHQRRHPTPFMLRMKKLKEAASRGRANGGRGLRRAS